MEFTHHWKHIFILLVSISKLSEILPGRKSSTLFRRLWNLACFHSLPLSRCPNLQHILAWFYCAQKKRKRKKVPQTVLFSIVVSFMIKKKKWSRTRHSGTKTNRNTSFYLKNFPFFSHSVRPDRVLRFYSASRFDTNSAMSCRRAGLHYLATCWPHLVRDRLIYGLI